MKHSFRFGASPRDIWGDVCRGVPVAGVPAAGVGLDGAPHMRGRRALRLLGCHCGPLHGWAVICRTVRSSGRPRSLQRGRYMYTECPTIAITASQSIMSTGGSPVFKKCRKELSNSCNLGQFSTYMVLESFHILKSGIKIALMS